MADASTGEAVALIDSIGTDFAAALEHGRAVGNPALRQTTYSGDTLQVALTCTEINPRETDGYGKARCDSTVANQDGVVVAQYDVPTLVAEIWP